MKNNKNLDLEFFTVILGEDGKIKLKFSDEIKNSIPVEKIEAELKESVDEHLTPIIEELVTLLIDNGMKFKCGDMNAD